MTDSPSIPATLQKQDGRRLSRDRNRLAVVDAMLDFYAEGNLRPGAQAVAERSGVSRRSVFRYFADLDDLDRTALERQQERVRHLVEIPGIGHGPLAGRIDAIALQRATLFTQIAPAARVSRIKAPFQPGLAEDLGTNRKRFAWQVELQFRPELDLLQPSRRTAVLAAAEVICSFEAFDLLQVTRGWDAAAFAAYVRTSLGALFGQP